MEFRRDKGGDSEGKYVFGETFSYADIFVAAVLKWPQLALKERWEMMKEWEGGEAGRMVENVALFESIQ